MLHYGQSKEKLSKGTHQIIVTTVSNIIAISSHAQLE